MAKVRRPFDVTTPAQVAALASLDDSAEIARRRGLNEEGLVRLDVTLREHGLTPADGAVGNFVYVEVGEDAPRLYDALLHEGVIVRPLAGFGAPARSGFPLARRKRTSSLLRRSAACWRAPRPCVRRRPAERRLA